MSEQHYLLEEEDSQHLTTAALQRHADYQGDHEIRLALRAMARKLLVKENPEMEPHRVSAWIDGHIRELKAPTRIMNVLYTCGFTTIRQVFEGGYDYLLRQNSFGLRCKDDLCEIFKRHGLLFRAYPCDAPVPNVEAVEPVVTVSMPFELVMDLVNACHSNLNTYQRMYGRFAAQGRYKDEHDRLSALVERAEALLREVEAQIG
ncbi:hypothetical protein EU642_22335 [Salmonella enterica]|nr:hypothetical protein [Salmonella enterica]EAO0118593.1 hypothetical protein [Salmonella enterica]EAO3601696.1 hypothetical protein [Salmonella enterica]EAR6391591.1 hypothetical protein [Salmonella enterica]EAV1285355.1 hypothetical protein [Salmonella enterica]